MDRGGGEAAEEVLVLNETLGDISRSENVTDFFYVRGQAGSSMS